MISSCGQFLKTKLQEIQEKNPRFSLRSFAKKIGISAGAMAELLNDKRALSAFYAEKISLRLKLSDTERDQLLSYVDAKSRKFTIDKTLEEREMQLLTGWQHFAILNLMKTEGFQSDPGWIGHRLGLSHETVESSLKCLLELGLISIREGQMKRTSNSICTTAEVPSKALVMAHKMDLLKAVEVLETTPPEVRSFTSITMPINVEKLTEAKNMIRDFRRRMSLFLETGVKQEVYNLNIQLYPLSQKVPVGERESS